MTGAEPQYWPVRREDLVRYLEAPLWRPWHATLPLIALTLAAASASYLIPARYRSSTLILVEAEKVPEALAPKAAAERAERLKTVKEEILSRTRLERVVKELKPYPGEEPAKTVGTMRAAVTIKVRGNDAFSIDYVHPNPRMAMAVANRLASLFTQEVTEERERRAQELSRSMESLLADARGELEAKEEGLRRFKEQHLGTLPDQLEANLSTLQRLQLEAQGVTENLSGAMSRLSALEGTLATPATPGPEAVALERLRGELAKLKMRYTDEHPDVKVLQSRIARMEKLLEKTSEGAAAGVSSQELQKARLEVERLNAKRQDLERRVAALEARVEQTPRTEQELTTLTRDYQTLKENYLSLLNKSMDARSAEKLEHRWKGETFRILDPAFLPERPVFPNRPLFLLGGLVAGLLVGFGVAVGAEHLDHSIRTIEELERLLSLPVLATIPHLSEKRPPAPELRYVRTAAPETAAEIHAAPETAVEAVPPTEAAAPAATAEEPQRVREEAPSEEVPQPRAEQESEIGEALAALLSAPAADETPAAAAEPPAEPQPPEAPPPSPVPVEPPAEARLPAAGAMRLQEIPRRARFEPSPAGAARLVVAAGPSSGAALTVDPAVPERLLGSAPRCHLRLDFGNVQAVHCRVAWGPQGLCIADAGSSTGTYVNGRRVYAEHPLQHGDVVFLGPPGSIRSAKLQVEVPPAGALAVEQPVAEILEPAAAVVPEPTSDIDHGWQPAARLPREPAPAPRRVASPYAPPPKPPDLTRGARARVRAATHLLEAGASLAAPLLTRRNFLAAGLVAVAFAGLLASRSLLRPAPALVSVLPAKAEPGGTVVLSGTGFDPSPSRNIVRFGEDPAKVTAASEGRLAVVVPSGLEARAPSELPLVVEARGSRSNAVRLRIFTRPRIEALHPEVAPPGEEVTLAGRNLSGPATVRVADVTTEVTDSGPSFLRFRVPAGLQRPEGSEVPVSVEVGGEQARPARLILGHLPLITRVSPSRGQAGERVTLRGFGFDDDPAGNMVTFGGREALVLSASSNELTVAAPGAGAEAGERQDAIVVRARGATSVNRAVYTLFRPGSGVFRPRFFAAPVPEHAPPDRAFVSTEIGPILLLSGSGGASSSAAERAAKVTAVLNDLTEVEAKPLALELRESPEPAVALAGAANVLVTATSDDVAAYLEGAGKGRRLTTRDLAAYWTALLQDYLALFVRRERPTRVVQLSARGQVLMDIYSEARRRSGPHAGVPTSLLSALDPDRARRLREMALLIASGEPPNTAAAVAGRWDGTIEETEKGRRLVQVRLYVEGKRLGGSMTLTSGKVTVNTPLRDVAYERGAVSFVLEVGTAPLRFSANVGEDSMAGLIRKARGDNEAVGFFSLRYVE